MIGSEKYFGQYGRISRIVINIKPHFTEKKREKFYSCYITYTTSESACLAIIVNIFSKIFGLFLAQ
jgi:hypothetical protein